jgi:hypothetical protein
LFVAATGKRSVDRRPNPIEAAMAAPGNKNGNIMLDREFAMAIGASANRKKKAGVCRVIVTALAGVCAVPILAGCSQNPLRSERPDVGLDLQSIPPGATATTSLGQSCRTPCGLSFPAPDSPVVVTYVLEGHEPSVVMVNVVRQPGDVFTQASAVADPNPAVARLEPAVAPKPIARKRSPKRKPAVAKATQPAAPVLSAPAGSVPAASVPSQEPSLASTPLRGSDSAFSLISPAPIAATPPPATQPPAKGAGQ